MTIQIFIQEEFNRRRAKNSKFSLRSFANLLNTDASSLSKIMNGQRVPSMQTLEKWASKLKLSLQQSQQLFALLAPDVAKKRKAKKNFAFDAIRSDMLTSEYEWFYPFIIEANNLKFSNTNMKRLAEHLGISETEIIRGRETLRAMGILKPHPSNSQKLLPSQSTTMEFKSTTQKLRSIQQKYLEMAIGAVDNVPIEKRENTTLTIALPKKDLQKIKDILKKARKRINSVAQEKTKQADTLYNVTMAIYPVFSEDPG